MQSTATATFSFFRAFVTVAALLAGRELGSAQFVSFWDQSPGTNQSQTHPNATLCNRPLGYGIGLSTHLKNITNGLETGVTLTLTNIWLSPGGVVSADSAAQNPSPGTPLYQAFYYAVSNAGMGQPTNFSYVYFGQSSNVSSIKLVNSSVNYIFTGLNPQARYTFRGGAVRGGDPSYQNRWTVVELAGAESFQPCMSSNVLTDFHTSELASNQVAVTFACNNTPETGDMVGWDDIAPGSDGSFSIICTRYVGPVPGGNSAGTFAYAITGFRLEEKIPSQIQMDLTSTGTVRISWFPATALLEQSTNLTRWDDSPFTNGAMVAPGGNYFFRVRR